MAASRLSVLSVLVWIASCSRLLSTRVQKNEESTALSVGTCDVRVSHESDFILDKAAQARAVNVPGHPWFWERIHDNFCGEPKPLTVLILGGSVETTPWVGIFCKWLLAELPGSVCKNGGAGSVGSSGVFAWMDNSEDANVDIHELRPDVIVLETSVNPWNQQKSIPPFYPPENSLEAYYVEQIVRKALQYDWHPVLIAWEWMDMLSHISMNPRFITNQDMHTHVYKYYGIPSVSVRDVLWPHLQGNTEVFPGNREFVPEGFVRKGFHNPANATYVDFKASMQPPLKLEDVFADGLHPSESAQKIVVDVLTRFISNGVQDVHGALQDGSIKYPEILPPILITQEEQRVMFPAGQDLPEAVDDTSSKSNKTILKKPDAADNSANITARATDVLIVLSGGSLLFWEHWHTWTLSHVGSAVVSVSQPPPMPMVELSLVRVISHLHIACMHYFMLQRDAMAAIFGFPNWAQWGWCWVQFFFMVSGFVLYLSNAGSQQDLSGQKFMPFMLKRLGTLYPVFLLSLVFTLANPISRELVQEKPVSFVSTILLLQSWIRPYGEVLLNGPSWYLCSLAAFYVVFPRWLQQVQRCSQPQLFLVILWGISWIVPAGTAALSLVTGRSAQVDLNSGLMSFLDFHPACNWQLFLFGMLLARCCCEWHGRWSKAVLSLVGTGALSFLLLLFALVSCPGPLMKVFFNKGPFLLPVYACLLTSLALCNSSPSAMFTAASKWISGWAWCLYILHVPLFYILRDGLDKHGISGPLPLAAFAALVSLIVYVVYDMPTQRLLQGQRHHSKEEVDVDPEAKKSQSLCEPTS